MRLFIALLIAINLGIFGVGVTVAQQISLVEFLPLINTGAMGVFLWGFYKEWWVTGGTNKRNEERINQLIAIQKAKDEEIARLNEYFKKEVVPAMIRFTDLLAQRTSKSSERGR